MNPEAFEASLSQKQLPKSISIYLQALWYDAAQNWQQAHRLIEHQTGTDAALVHAYLHRQEGDVWNADYWYAKAGRKRPNVSLEEEWQQLVTEFLKSSE